MAASPHVVPAVFKAIADVRNEINSAGIAKDRQAEEGTNRAFHFRGIDNVLNEFSGPMLRAGLMMFPSYSELTMSERKTSNGKANYHCLVCGTYTLVSTIDGTTFPVGSFYGEANDTQDKAVAKAQSIALRQAYLQTFVVPLGAEMDPEVTLQLEPIGETPPVEDGAPQARAVEGELMDKPNGQRIGGSPLSASQQRVLNAKMKAAGIGQEDIDRKFGGVLTSSQYTAALDWVGEVITGNRNRA